jgi:hypothetical protein
MNGRDCNGIHDGYSWMPFYMGHTYSSSFSHTHDFEPATTNHISPQYGIFAKAHFYFSCLTFKPSAAIKYTKDNHGPPNFSTIKVHDELEHNEILQAAGVLPEEVRHPAQQARLSASVDAA